MRTLALCLFACTSALLTLAASAGLSAAGADTRDSTPPRTAHRSRSYSLPSADSRPVRAAQEILDPRRSKGRILEEVASDLAHVGSEVVPVCVAMLIGTLATSNWKGGAGIHYGDFAAQNVREDEVLFETLRRFDPALVAESVAAACTGKTKLDVRLVGMRILTETGNARSIPAWLEIAGEIEPLYLQGACVQGPLEGALASMLERDPTGFVVLVEGTKSAPRPLLPLIVRAVAAAQRTPGVELLLSWLGRDRDLDLELLHELPSLVEHTSGGLSEEQLSWLRPFLSDEDWRVRRSAAQALGRVGDARSYRELAALLGDDQRLVAQAAGWALAHMSGKELGTESAPWIAWYEDETGWYQDEGARLFEALRSNEDSVALDAARTLCQRPLFKHEIGRAIAELLTHRDPAVVKGLCSALGSLGSMAAAPALVTVLDRPEEAARRAAHAALVRLTGRKFALEEPDRWVKLVRG